MGMTLREAKQDELISLVYAPYAVRRKASRATKERATDANNERTMNNVDDDGRKGKTFEVDLRRYINPNTCTLKCQKQSFADVPLYVGKNRRRIILECKTGGGAIIENIWLDDWRKELKLKQDLNFDYIAYTFEYNGDRNTLEDNTIVMSKTAFIRWCRNYNPNNPHSFLTYKKNEGRVMIANPKASKKRTEYVKGLAEWAQDQRGCYTLKQFMELTKRV